MVLARRSDRWLLAGLNATNKPMALSVELPMLAGQTVTLYDDAPAKRKGTMPEGRRRELKVGKSGRAKLVIQPMGGLVVTQ